ncbi:sensor histidine kinase [Limnothrix redekei]
MKIKIKGRSRWIGYWQQRISNWHFSQKIALGYVLAIATGVVGSLAGIALADHFQGRGVAQLHDATTQVQLLSDLRSNLQAARLAIDEAGDDEIPAAQRQLFQQDAIAAIQAARDLANELTAYLKQNPQWLADRPDRLLHLANQSVADLQEYANQQVLMQQANEANQSAAQKEAKEAAEALEWKALAGADRTLARLVTTAHGQAEQAEVLLEEAQGLEKGIVILSLLLSAAVAGVIAMRVTRAIVNPLVRAATVAQGVAETGDFSQRVGITSQDEVGSLAQALDTLIERVAERNQELADAADLASSQARTLYRTLMDLRRTQAQLIQTEKMSLLGQVVAGVAHEINNPTSFIYGNLIHVTEGVSHLLELLTLYEAGHGPHSPEIRSLVEQLDLEFVREDLPQLMASMRSGAERIRAIVLSLRLFARLDEAEVKAINLPQSLDSVLTILGSRLCAQAHRPAIVVQLDYGPLPPIECYAGQLNQVLMHILTNAIDAIDEAFRQRPDRPLTLKLATRTLDPDWVSLAITDSGLGIPVSEQSRIFELFYTTKPVGKGSGMGLAIAQQVIVEKHGGTIDCESGNWGTTFTLKLPVRLAIADPAQPQATHVAVLGDRQPNQPVEDFADQGTGDQKTDGRQDMNHPKTAEAFDRDDQAPIEPLASDGLTRP